RRGRQGRRGPPGSAARREERPLATRPGQFRPNCKGQACGVRRVRDPRRQHEGDGQARPDPQERRRRPTCPQPLLCRGVRRCEREERAAGRSERAALEAAAATSGRSVLISGLTVMVAMAGLFLTGDATFASFGYATMIVVAVAMVGSLTVLPALLSKLGDRVERLHVPLVGRLRRNNGEGRIWGAIVERVLRRPLLSAVVAGGALLALAAPALQLRMATPGPDTFPKSLDVVKTYDRMQQAFPGKALPANVVVKAPDVNAPAVRQAINRLERRALASGRAREPITIDKNGAGTIANITVPIEGRGTDAASNASLAVLREKIVPETVGALPNTETGVTGLTAEWKDQQQQLKSKLPLVVAFVLLFAFGLMLVAFRSIVVAIK